MLRLTNVSLVNNATSLLSSYIPHAPLTGAT